jgi:hypothetical protein
VVKVANWYLDRPGDVLERSYDRADLVARAIPYWRKQVVADLSRTLFPAQRNEYCKYCPYHAKRGGPCTEGA